MPQNTQQQLRAMEGDRDGEIRVLDGGVSFLDYFERQWLDTVTGWTHEQRMRAANAMGVALEKVPRTNNHTEGFHSGLKGSQLGR